jgi:hypothetical protein
MDAAYSPAKAPSHHRPAVAFLQDVLATYHAHFWLFLKFVVPAAIFGYCAVILAGGKAQDILSSLPRGPRISEHWAEILAALFLRFGGFLVSWVILLLRFRRHFGCGKRDRTRSCALVGTSSAGSPRPAPAVPQHCTGAVRAGFSSVQHRSSTGGRVAMYGELPPW